MRKSIIAIAMLTLPPRAPRQAASPQAGSNGKTSVTTTDGHPCHVSTAGNTPRLGRGRRDGANYDDLTWRQLSVAGQAALAAAAPCIKPRKLEEKRPGVNRAFSIAI